MDFSAQAQALGAVVTLAVVLAHGLAAAVEPVRLDYAETPAAVGCPGEAELRRLVVGRLGYDPFRGDGGLRISVEFDRSDAGFLARLELTRGAQSLGARALDSRRTCAELTELVALSLSIAIDPDKAMSEPANEPDVAATEVAPKPVSTASEPARAAVLASSSELRGSTAASQAPPERPSAPWRLGASLVSELAFGLLPEVATGGQAAIRLRRRQFSLELAGLAMLPTEFELGAGGFVRAQAFAATLSPCVWKGPWSVCGLVSAVRVLAESQGTVVPRSGGTWYGAIGAGAGFEWPERSSMALLVRGSASLHWQEVAIVLDEVPVWTASSVSAAAAVGAVARF